MKIRPVGVKFFHVEDRQKDGRTDKRTDMTTLIVVFPIFLRKRVKWLYYPILLK